MINYDDENFQAWLHKANPQPSSPDVACSPWHMITDGLWFPFPSARSGQVETVMKIREKTEEGYRVLVNGGTGFGKSPTMMALAATYGSAYILVGKNDLVEQYRRDFERLEHVGFLKSKAQFRCSIIPGQSCHDADAECKRVRLQAMKFVKGGEGSVHPVLLHPSQALAMKTEDARIAVEEALEARPCPYSQNRDFALVQNYTVMTVAMALTVFSYLGNFPPLRQRDIIIVDECSELESELMGFFETVLNTKRIFEATLSHAEFRPRDEAFLPIPTNLEEVEEWVKAMHGIISPLMSDLEENPAAYDQRRATAIRSVHRNLIAVRLAFRLKLPLHFEIEHTGFYGPADRGHDTYKIIVKPLECRGLYDRVFGAYGRRHVFCSATTGTPEVWQATHQMNQAVTYLEVGSPFPKENRPIIYKPLGKMTKAQIDRDLPEYCQQIVALCQQDGQGDPRFNHKHQKGLIHTYTTRIADALLEAFYNAGLAKRVTALKGSGAQRAEIMAMFKASDQPKILISPSAMLGISLDDDAGRFQIIAKTPYPYLGDPGVKYRQDNIKDWYSWQTSKDIIQACGRVVRSPTDWGITYIVDEAFANHLRWNGKQFPDWWHEAYQSMLAAPVVAALPDLPPIPR